MKKIVLAILVSVVFFSSPNFVFSETVILKSGYTLEGKLTEKTDDYIKIDFEGVSLTYYLDEIESIDGKKQPVSVSLKDTPVLNVAQESDSGYTFPPVMVSESGLRIDEPLKREDPSSRQNLEYFGSVKSQGEDIPSLSPRLVRIIGMFSLFIIFGILAFYVYSAICLQIIAKKTDQGPYWFAWVPIANLFLSCKIAGLKYVWLLILFSLLIPVIGSICVAAFFAYLWYRIAIALNKPGWIGALTIIPIANLVIIGYLAFSKD